MGKYPAGGQEMTGITGGYSYMPSDEIQIEKPS